MAIDITFYSFAKRSNSTKRPTGGTTYSCVLKDPASVTAPVILLDRSNPSSLNYAYIPTFNRYYYISDWTSDHGLWEARLIVDPLASFKNSIGSSSQYVTRAYSESDPYLIDSIYPMTEQISLNEIKFNDRPFCRTGSPLAVISTTSSAGPKVGGATYYLLTMAQVKQISEYLYAGGWFDTNPDFGLTDGIMKAIINPIEYIGECYFLGYGYPSEGMELALFNVGWWPVNLSHSYYSLKSEALTNRYLIWSKNVVLDSHPQRNRGFYMQCQPYTEIELYASVFGKLVLDPMKYANSTSIDLSVYGDFKGGVDLTVTDHQSGEILDRFYANTAIPFSLSQLSSHYAPAGNLFSSAVDTFSVRENDSAFSELSRGTGLLQNLAASATGYLMPKVSRSAGVSSVAYLAEDWWICQTFHYQAEQSLVTNGSPLCKVRTISDLSGYIQVDRPQIEIAGAYDQEVEQIVTAMSAGFYWE